MDEQTLLKLDNQLCFTIYACSREISRLYRPLLDKLGLTYPQYLVLLILWEQQESTVKELGELLYLDSGTLTPMLKRMEAAGLIIRERSSEDERKVIIRLTEQGRDLREKATCIPKALLTQSGISREEFIRLLNQCKQLLERVHQLNEKFR
ncbi:MarR family winged helix-turn-helix transcriptional regulator [Lihuaxuella thermophila]|uniref:DNA-binding transcriptional regulator, MarR family n=1 Tax=Lihuaxuella thermophila TaxID=1173111 RepID=A0A1H8IBQ2_9BACL|nr:MarR family transcriptional regulator [Lihuaxuella thermophila]SEN65627.1 DNA-binding transcriptional regulator, MarR family [Lihuaxuella thermophila]